MPAAKTDLETIILREDIISGDYKTKLQLLTKQLAISILCLHRNGYIHGDLKPLNIMKVEDNLKLIDLDASCKIGIDYAATKFSSGYLPPEMFYEDEDGRLNVRSADKEDVRVIASESLDCWAFGVVLYLSYSKSDLFCMSYDGNIITQDMFHTLKTFTDEYKTLKLEIITDTSASNLVSLLLMKDVNKRLTMDRVL